MVFNWFESDGRCYLRSNWKKSVIGNALGEMARWKPWSGHRLTLPDKSHLPKSPPSGRKILNPQHIPVDISYKWSNAYKQVWKGDGHSAWAGQNLEASYCSLGDKIAIGQDPPLEFNLLLRDQSAGKKFLVRPIDFQIPEGQKPLIDGLYIWNMVLPEGFEDYICFGHAVSDSRKNKPDRSRYCCAKNTILIEGAEQSVANVGNGYISNVVRGKNASSGILDRTFKYTLGKYNSVASELTIINFSMFYSIESR